MGGEREGARGGVPSLDFQKGAARPTCPGLCQEESGSGEQQPCLLPLLLTLPLLLSVSQYSLAEVTPSLPPSLPVSSAPPSHSFLCCTLRKQSLLFCLAHSPLLVLVVLFQTNKETFIHVRVEKKDFPNSSTTSPTAKMRGDSAVSGALAFLTAGVNNT